jgi:nucleoside-diphosphate-sugar epimerase
MVSRVLILGARGRFGLAAARAFSDAGWQVVGHMRPGATAPAEAASDPRITWLSSNLYDTVALAQAAHSADVVVHALNPAYTHKAWQAEALPMAQAALDVSRALGATLMFMGNIYNFGREMPAVLREYTPQRAQTVKGRIRIAIEQLIEQSDVRAVVIRAGDFFGSGQGTWFDQVMVKDIRKGALTYPGPPDVATAWAYLPDLAKTFVEVAERRAQLLPFEVFHFAGHSVTARDWVAAITPIARRQGWVAAGADVRLGRLPWAFIRLAAWVVPIWAALAEMRYLWDAPHALANAKLVALIGAEPRTELALALAQSLADLGLVAQTKRGAAGVWPESVRAEA